MENSDAQGEEEEGERAVDDFLRDFWAEIRAFRKYFSWNAFIEAVLLKFFLPLNDIISDFLLAEKFHNIIRDPNINRWVTFFSYYFISCPGLMFLLSNLHMFRFSPNRTNSFKSVIVSFVLMVCVLCLEVVFIQHAHEKILFPAAILVSTCILILGTMEIVFHGPMMRKLSNLVASYEGRFEAAPQLLLHVILLMTLDGNDGVDGDENVEQYFEYLDIYGLLTSLAMLGKDLTENILLNGTQDYQHKPFTSKLMMMGKFLPVVLLTTIFRLGSLALAIHHIFILQTGSLIVALKLFLLLPPALTIMYFSKLTNKIPELTVVDSFLGIVGELSSFIIWGKLGWDRSRWINLWFTLYFGFLYGSYCVWTVFNPPHKNADLYAIFFLCCGWFAFPLFISQIFIGSSSEGTETQENRDNFNISLI